MNSKFYKIFLGLLSSMFFILASASADAWYHHGYRHHGWYHTYHSCCFYRYRHCGWVPGHYRHGHWIHAHRVCWR